MGLTNEDCVECEDIGSKFQLKTLKDFGDEGATLNGEQVRLYDNFELKKEAIKHVKHLRLWKNQGCIKILPYMNTTDPSNIGLNAIINYIIWQNNITEENLK